MLEYVFLILFLIDAVADIIVVVKKNKRFEHLFKPLLMPLLAMYYVFTTFSTNVNWLIVLAILFGCVGDTFLMFDDEKWFLLGMVGFLLGHVFYIISFLLSVGSNIIAFPLWGIVLILPVILILFFTYPRFKDHLGAMKIPVYVYMAFIITMHFTAILRLSNFEFMNPAFFLTWLGSILFIFSDSLIAIDTFNEEIKIPYIRVYIMSTYIVGQFLITQGIIMANL